MNRCILPFIFGAALLATGCASPENQSNPSAMPGSDYLITPIHEIAFIDDVATMHGEPFTGVVGIYTSGNVLLSEQAYLNGAKEGVWRVYHPNGNLQKEGIIENGLEHGRYREWYANGQLKYEYHYNAGKKVGKWLSWYEDGTPYTERNFVNDQLEGKVLVWDEEGLLAKEYDYRAGRQVNAIMHFENR
ncbi:MAG: toxin-antitoxin system YwqK family antitoxin [Cryomorphaceae bacterium]|nr:MAG: toxin-antitoxin system YwqK family antitoxin [Cryomorphaceae bacterium]